MFKKLIIVSIVVFIGIIGLGSIYLNNVYIPKHLKPLVIDLIKQNLNKDVNIDKAFYFPFKGVLFSGIHVQNTDGSQYLEVDNLDLSLKSFPKIRTNKVSLKARLIVKGVDLNQQGLIVNGNTVADLVLEIVKNKAPVFRANIKLDDLQIKGINNIADIEKINGEIICDQESFSSTRINAIISKQPLNLIFDGKYSQTDFVLNQLKINYGQTSLEIKAKAEDFEKLNIATTATGLIDLGDISKILAIDSLPLLTGVCSFTADANGPVIDLAKFKATAQAAISLGAVDKIKFSDLKANIRFEQAALNLAPLTCVFYNGKISAALKAEIKDIIPIQGSLEIEQVNLQPLIKDIIGQDMGTGQFNAHAGVSGNAIDINNLTGSGWFKIEQASLKPPPNFKKVANSINLPELSDMRIEQSNATFSLIDGKAKTEDFIAISDYATLYGKGYIDFEQYVDFEVKFKLSDEFAARSGKSGQYTNIAAGGVKVKLFGKIPHVQYKPDFSVEDMFKNQGDEILKALFDPDDAQQNDSEKVDLQKQLKQGLKNLFK
ncbi:MAG: AsmA family protein [Candidatus Omnitrophica bacterium]|nr:AsmA family protein [Candidatus Omnitrophota bacterium]